MLVPSDPVSSNKNRGDLLQGEGMLVWSGLAGRTWCTFPLKKGELPGVGEDPASVPKKVVAEMTPKLRLP